MYAGFKHALVLLPALAFCASPALAALYRIVDESGNITYADSVTPSQNVRARAKLNTSGVLLQDSSRSPAAADRTKSAGPEYRNDEDRLQLERQREADRLLLRSFPREQDIELARADRIAGYDLQLDLLSGTARLKQRRLLALQARIDRRRLHGMPVDPSLDTLVGDLERQILDAYGQALRTEQTRRAVSEEYTRYLTRYRELKGLAGESSSTGSGELGALSQTIGCAGPEECASRWQRAADHLTDTSGVTPAFRSDALLLIEHNEARGNPVTALSLIRATEAGHRIFLDLHCRADTDQRDECTVHDAPAIRRELRAAVTANGRNEEQTTPARRPPTQARAE